MYVKDWMTKEPVCLTREDSINLAFKAMKDGHFHRVPIVEGTKLVGLITESTLSDYTPSKATTLSVFEMNSILQRTTCGDVMVKDVVTIDQNALLEEAADKMNVNNVACLPVVDDKNNVIGIITQKAIFGAFVELTPGIDALLHVSQIAKEHIEKPSDVLKIGQEIEAKVVDFNEADKKISLSMKALLAPEEDVAEAVEEAPAEDAE